MSELHPFVSYTLFTISAVLSPRIETDVWFQFVTTLHDPAGILTMVANYK